MTCPHLPNQAHASRLFVCSTSIERSAAPRFRMIGTRRSTVVEEPKSGGGGAGKRARPVAEVEPSTETKKPKESSAPVRASATAGSAKQANPKFRPLPIGNKNVAKVPVVTGKVPRGASILIIQRPWIDLILDGYKTLEIRGKACTSKVGQRIYLALSGGGGVILGSAHFIACHGPLGRSDWLERAPQHCVAGEKLPYGSSTHAWELVKPQRFEGARESRAASHAHAQR